MVGFYPVSSGMDNGIEHLRAKVAQGFSIMVFPEGSRSENNSINRFHKGAFYLAEEFKLDIIPVVIHGYSEVLPKGDFVINGGKTTVEILDRIHPSDSSFGKDYAERTKKLSSFFKLHYKQMRLNLEGPNYFKKMILNSFDFKEIQVIRAVKKDLDTHLELYYELNKWIDPKARILHLGNDYGQLDVLLVLQEPQRKIDSMIISEENRAVAQSNYIIEKRKIYYLDQTEEAILRNYDFVLISDENAVNDLETICNCTETIVLLNTENLKESLLKFGFKTDIALDGMIITKKNTL